MEMEELESYVPPLSEGEVESDDEEGDISKDIDDEGGESDTEEGTGAWFRQRRPQDQPQQSHQESSTSTTHCC